MDDETRTVLADTSRSRQREVSFEEAFAFAQLHGAIYAEVAASINLNLQVVLSEHMQHIFNTLKAAYMPPGSSSVKKRASVGQGPNEPSSAADLRNIQT